MIIKQMNSIDFLNSLESIECIITDLPYKAFSKNKFSANKVGDLGFNVKEFCDIINHKLDRQKGIFITFCNILLMKDLFQNLSIPFLCEQIWDKRPTRNWIAYSRPLREIEYILYFGYGKLDFRDGTIKEKYNRKGFGQKDLVKTNANTKDFAEGQFRQIVSFPQIKHKIHPTEKPKEASAMFKQILRLNEFGLIIDPFCGSGNLLHSFENSLGIDIVDYITKKENGSERQDE